MYLYHILTILSSQHLSQAEAGLAATVPFLNHGLGPGLGHHHAATGRGQLLVPELWPSPASDG